METLAFVSILLFLFLFVFFVYFKLINNINLAALKFQNLQAHKILVPICFKNSQTDKISLVHSVALPREISEGHNSNNHLPSPFQYFQ